MRHSISFLCLMAPALLTGAEVHGTPQEALPMLTHMAAVQSDTEVRLGAEASGSNAPVSDESQSRGYCREGMAEVAGEYCENLAQYCVKYDGDPARDRCLEFRTSSRCVGPKKPVRVCVDRYEYPNREGEKPVVAVNWEQAGELCAAEGKRLCTSDEWTLACEGSEGRPYPYGTARDSEACNIDKPYIMPDNEAFANPDTREEEIARVDQREPSGARARCVSSFGVHDMTGNVDEWVHNEGGSDNVKPFNSGLKGGWWGPVRNRCRPMTLDHNKWHKGYQIGFRCCSDVREAAPNAGQSGGADPALRGS